MSPLIPPDQTVDAQHAHQVQELIAGCQAVSCPQEVSVERIVIQLQILAIMNHFSPGLDHLGAGKTHGHAYNRGDGLGDGKYFSKVGLGNTFRQQRQGWRSLVTTDNMVHIEC